MSIDEIVENATAAVLSSLRQLKSARGGERFDPLYAWLIGPGEEWFESTIRSAVLDEMKADARSVRTPRSVAAQRPYTVPTTIRADKVPGVDEMLEAAGGLPAEARAAIALVLPFAAPSDVRWGLNGAHLGVVADDLPGGFGITGPFYAVTTDVHRIGLVGFDCGAQNAEMRELLKDRRRRLYKLDDEGNLTMIEGEFPDFTAVLPSSAPRPFALDFDIRKRFNDFRAYVASKTPPEVIEAAERKKMPSWRGGRVSPMTSHTNGRYTMVAPLSDWLKGDAAVFEFGTGTPLGEEGGGRKFHSGNVGINAPYFHAALEFAAPNAIRSAHPLAPIMFTGDHNRIAVVMPMRLD